ncbi:MAG: CDP-alcohol phosphatidyltransferase family protein [Legionellales bacterium]|nr:CDP-alcohol phosphatidyltransferase family protein [Legionellales bacterium]
MRNRKPLYLSGWIVHLLTSSGAFLCILSLIFIHKHQWINSIWALAGCLVIDSIDGTLARKFKVKQNIPQIDGALLDNLVDFVAYVIVPCFFIYVRNFVSPCWTMPIIFMIIIASSYQFSHQNAKTKDNFFRGFPCFWNFTIFYMLIIDGSQLFNLCIYFLLITLVFIPIKYLY